MRKFISIIIPRYKETESDIFPLLSSINNQIGINFDDIEVIIANDGEGAGPLDDIYLQLFENLDIKQVNSETNVGPGVNRQNGLDAAKGDYVLFCDADDILHSVAVLGAFIHEAEANAPDMLSSSWLEELKDTDGNVAYIEHDIENTWMHGKLLRRRFLTQNNIRFHPDLRVHEDSYILSIAAAVAQKKFHLPITTYVWKFQQDSITRHDNGIYTYESHPTFLKACCMSFSEIERLNPSQMEFKVVQFILYNFFTLHQAHWNREEVRKYLEQSESTFAKKIKPFWKYWENATPEYKAQIYNEERQKNFANQIETETLNDWLIRLGFELTQKMLF